MIVSWSRLGIRARIMFIVIISAVLTTAITLVIADSSIQSYGIEQEKQQVSKNLKVATLVLQSQYGPSVSISATGDMVIDLPNTNIINASNSYGKLPLNVQTAYVDQVHSLLGGDQVSIFQCANSSAERLFENGQLQCKRISSSIYSRDTKGNIVPRSLVRPDNTTVQVDRDIWTADHKVVLSQTAIAQMNLGSTTQRPNSFTGQDRFDGISYMVAYQPLFDPQGQVIGVLSVAEPLTAVTDLINTTTLELIVSGLIIMIAGIILAVLVASAISRTLQDAATQLSNSATQLSQISGQQAAGSRQQVWAINAINQALSTLQEVVTDVSRRTDDLAQMGVQVVSRKQEITTAQFESVISYMTRSVHAMSDANHRQKNTVEQMSGAMTAVVEIADQVSGISQQTAESSKRLDGVIVKLQQLVVGHRRVAKNQRATMMDKPGMSAPAMDERPASRGNMSRPNAAERGNMSMPGAAARSSRPQPQMGMADGRGSAYDMTGDRSGQPPMPNVQQRPMLPGPRPARPGMPSEAPPAGGNYPNNYGEPTSWSQWDQGSRNQ